MAAVGLIVAASAAATATVVGEAEEGGGDRSAAGRIDNGRSVEGRRNAVRINLRPLLPTGARTVAHRTRSARVAVPPGWHHSTKNLVPLMAGPGSILAVATFRPRVDERRACGLWPDMPQVAVGSRDALFHVEEQIEAQPGRLPARPKRFVLARQLRTPGRNDLFSVFPWRCLNRPGIVGLRSSFRAHGRLMHVTAVAGERTSRRLRRELLGVAESLRFGPTAPVTVGVHPATGRPATRFHLELVSTHPTGKHGRRFREYWAAAHGPHKTACVIENEAWFSYGPPRATLRATLDPRRTKGNRWCRGHFRGVVRYRDAICSGGNACERVYIRRAGRFTFTVR